ncbi:hypothetical protein L2K20_09195 [Mycobacterium sp. MBM]|nr:hypothetical protein [Mycobacterium sp. MBM]
MKKIIIGAVGAAITAGTLIFAPPAMADPGVTQDRTEEVTQDGLFPAPFQIPVALGHLTHEPSYQPSGMGLGVREVRSVHSAYTISASNPTA